MSQKEKKKLIIFDYDGVIVDSFPAQYECYKVIAEKLGKKIETNFDEFKANFLSGNYLKYWEKIGISTLKEVDLANEIFAKEAVKRKPPLFPGMKELLSKLEKKYFVALLSASNLNNVVDKLNHHKISSHFHHVIAKDHLSNVPLLKSSELPKLLALFGVSACDAVMIGDRNVDYREAKAVGINKIILVNYGWGFDREKTPDRVPIEVNEPKDILKALNFIGF